MEQLNVAEPRVTSDSTSTWITGFATLRIHIVAHVLRLYVWYISGDGTDFDRITTVETPGLGSGRVRCAICLPRSSDLANKAKPLILVFEGGGFILGQPEDGQKHDRRLSDELGAIVISVDYAKAPRYPYPHALLQLYQVLKWATSAAAVIQGVKVDSSKVAFLGNSAGGNLVASLSSLLAFTTGPNAAFRKDLPDDFQQVLQVMLYPSIDTGLPYATRFRRATPAIQAQSLPISIAQLMEDAYLPSSVDRNCLFVRPMLLEDDLLPSLMLPPALIITAGLDCLETEATLYAAKLKQGGVQVTSHSYPFAKHGFSHYQKGPDFRKADVEDCWKRVADRLRQAFTGASSPTPAREVE